MTNTWSLEAGGLYIQVILNKLYLINAHSGQKQKQKQFSCNLEGNRKVGKMCEGEMSIRT